MATPQEILDQTVADLGLSLSNAQEQNLLSIIGAAQDRGDDVSLALLGSVAARDALEAEYGELTGAALSQAIGRLGDIVTDAEDGAEPTPEPTPEPTGITEALIDLQAANEAKETFLTEQAIASELVLDAFSSGDYDTAEEALAAIEDDASLTVLGSGDTSIEGAVNAALVAAEGDGSDGAEGALSINTQLDAAVTAIDGKITDEELTDAFAVENNAPSDTALVSFDGASDTIQDTFISEVQASLAEVTQAAEAAVAEYTGLSGRIDTLQTRKAEFEAALENEFAVQESFSDEALSFAAVNDIVDSDAASNDFVVFSGDSFGFDENSDGTLDDGEVVANFTDGEWVAVDDTQDNINDLLAVLEDRTEALDASSTAKTRFETALERVVQAEQSDNDITVATDDGYSSAVAAEDVIISLDLSDGEVGSGGAVLSEALVGLRESQVALDEALADLTEARGLDQQLTALDDDITAAQDVFGEDFDLNLIDLASEDGEATAESDIFLFAEDAGNAVSGGAYVDTDQGEVINLLGEQGQDHIFFGSTDYQLVELAAGDEITDRVGAADQLEVFWQQDGADLTLFVESEAAAGTDLNAENVTKVTLTEFSATDIDTFENGLLSTAPVEVA